MCAGAGDEALLDTLLRRIVFASDKTNRLFALRDQSRQGARSIGGAEITQVNEEEIRGDRGLRQKAGHEEFLAGIIRRNVEQRAAELEAMTQDQIETIVGVTARHFLHLREADVFRVGGLKSGSQRLQTVEGKLAPASIGDHAGKQQYDARLFGLGKASRSQRRHREG